MSSEKEILSRLGDCEKKIAYLEGIIEGMRNRAPANPVGMLFGMMSSAMVRRAEIDRHRYELFKINPITASFVDTDPNTPAFFDETRLTEQFKGMEGFKETRDGEEIVVWTKVVNALIYDAVEKGRFTEDSPEVKSLREAVKGAG